MNLRGTKGHGLRTTFVVESPEFSRSWHIKLRPAAEAAELQEEASRIRWAKGRLPVPERSMSGRLPGIGFLITKTIEGTPSYKFIGTLEPSRIVSSISTVIHMLHEINTINFPFSAPAWTNEQTMLEGLHRIARSRTRYQELHPDFARRTLAELRNIVKEGPGDNQKVLAHGDLCMPNVLLDSGGSVSGIVDLGALHVGHSKLDLGIMSWTMQASMGDRWADKLLETHGTDRDDQGLLYSRLAYDLSLQRPEPWAWTQARALVEQRARLSVE